MTEEKSQLHSLKLQQQQCSPAVRKYVEHVHKTAQAELARRTQMGLKVCISRGQSARH